MGSYGISKMFPSGNPVLDAKEPTVGLALKYDMETLTSDGKMKDFSGNGNHGTITGTTDVAGKFGRARNFVVNNTNKIAASPSVSGLTIWTMLHWFRWDGSVQPFAHTFGMGAGHEATIYVSDSNDGINAKTNIVDRNIAMGITAGTWHHVAASFDGNDFRTYFDGMPIETINAVGSVLTSNNANVGTSGVGSANDAFGGTVDEVLVFDRVLSANEIASLALDDRYTPRVSNKQDYTVEIRL